MSKKSTKQTRGTNIDYQSIINQKDNQIQQLTENINLLMKTMQQMQQRFC